MIIKNKEELLSRGIREGREIALDVIEYAIGEVDAYKLTKKMVHIENNKLIVGNLNYNRPRARG